MIELPVVSKETVERKRKPNWLRVKLPIGPEYAKVRKLVDENKLHTICESGNCPNMGECWGAGTATFMILGNVCTRSCSFCAVATGRPPEYDEEEPVRVAEAITVLKDPRARARFNATNGLSTVRLPSIWASFSISNQVANAMGKRLYIVEDQFGKKQKNQDFFVAILLMFLLLVLFPKLYQHFLLNNCSKKKNFS